MTEHIDVFIGGGPRLRLHELMSDVEEIERNHRVPISVPWEQVRGVAEFAERSAGQAEALWPGQWQWKIHKEPGKRGFWIRYSRKPGRPKKAAAA